MSVPSAKTAKKIADVNSCREAVPPVVVTAYEPSGAFEAQSIPLLIAGSVVGWVVGSLITAATIGVTVGVFKVLAMMGRCHPAFFLGALALYFLAPIAIPIAQGIYIGKSTKWGRCRSTTVTMVMSSILGLLTAGVMIFAVGPILTVIGEGFDISMKSCSAIHPTMLDEPYKLYIYGGVMAVLSLLIAIAVSTSAVKDYKFCEKCSEYLKDTVVARFPLQQVKPVVLTLLERSWNYNALLRRLPDRARWESDDERVDVVHSKCRCKKANFIECKVYWVEITRNDNGSENKNKHNRLVYSGQMTPDDANAAIALLTQSRPADVPATPVGS